MKQSHSFLICYLDLGRFIGFCTETLRFSVFWCLLRFAVYAFISIRFRVSVKIQAGFRIWDPTWFSSVFLFGQLVSFRTTPAPFTAVAMTTIHKSSRMSLGDLATFMSHHVPADDQNSSKLCNHMLEHFTVKTGHR